MTANSSSPPPCPTPMARSTSATSWNTSRPTSGCGSSACRAHGALRLRRRRARRADHDRGRKGRARRRRSSSPTSPPAGPTSTAFHIGFDNWHSTDSPENHELAPRNLPRLAQTRDSLIRPKAVEQFYDPVKGMFLPDRYIKGECPKCGAKDQYGDTCEVCGAVYAPTDLKNPYSALSGATPVMRTSEHYFFKLSDPQCVAFLQDWLETRGPPAARGGQQGARVARRRRQSARRLGHLARCALLRHSRFPTRRASISTSGWMRRSATWPR